MDSRSPNEILNDLNRLNEQRKESGLPASTISQMRGESVGHKPIEFSEKGGFGRRFLAYIIDGAIVSIFWKAATTYILFPLFIQHEIDGIIDTAMLAVGNGKPDMAKLFLLFGKFTGKVFFINMAFFPVIYGLYVLACRAVAETTVGRLLMELDVFLSETGERIGALHLTLRDTIGKSISSFILMIGFLMAAFREDGRALHDLIFKTEVRRKNDELAVGRVAMGCAVCIIVWLASILIIPNPKMNIAAILSRIQNAHSTQATSDADLSPIDFMNWSKAKTSFLSGDFQASLEAVNKFLATHPGHSEALFIKKKVEELVKISDPEELHEASEKAWQEYLQMKK